MNRRPHGGGPSGRRGHNERSGSHGGAAETSFGRGNGRNPSNARLTADQLRQARQQGRQGGSQPPVLPPIPGSRYEPPEPPEHRRSRRKLWFILTPILLVLIAAAISAPTLLKARTAYQKIFVTSAPRPVVTVNAEGTAVIVPDATQQVSLPDWNKKQRVNILLLGADTNAARSAQGDVPLSDTIIIASIDPATKKVGLLSIPRDLLVDIPGVGQAKINAAYSNGSVSDIGGPGLVRATIEYNFGIKIDYYAVVDFAGFQKIVDTLGGVTLDVPTPIKDDAYPGEKFNYTRIVFQSGLQHMNGIQALRYVRTRHDDNDFARGNRQQQLLMALRQQSLSLGLIAKAPDLIAQLGDTVRTDLPPSDALRLAKLGAGIKSSDITSYNLLDATTSQWNPGEPYYLIPDWTKIHQILDQMMPKAAKQSNATSAGTSAEQANLRAQVLVENGTFVNKLASRTATTLNDNGFLNVSITQASDAGNYPTSQVIDYSGNLATAKLIAETLGLPTSSVQPGNPSDAKGQDVVVILGDDAPTNPGS